MKIAQWKLAFFIVGDDEKSFNYSPKLMSTGSGCNPRHRLKRIQQRQLIAFQTFDMFEHQIEMFICGDAKFLL